MDGDGLVDIVTCNIDSLDVSVLRNTSSPPPPPFPYPGTMEDLVMLTGIDGMTPTTGPGSFIKSLTGPGTIEVCLESPGGAFTGTPFAIGLELFVTGMAPPPTLPELHLVSPIILIDTTAGPIPIGLPASGFGLTVSVPGGLSGISGLFQAVAFSTQSTNGFFASTNGHEIQASP